MTKADVASLPIDAVRVFNELCDHLYVKISPKKLFLDTTTFGFESLFMTEGQQLRYINYAFQDNDKLNTPINGLFKNICICLECIKEDQDTYGESYLHRKHHYSGIFTCYRHKVNLLRFKGTNGHACDFNLEEYQKLDSNKSMASLTAYTKYVCEIAENSISADIFTFKKIIFSELKKRGYSVRDNYDSLVKDFNMWKHAELFDGNLANFLKLKMIVPNYIFAQELTPLLMFLFPDINQLIVSIEPHMSVIKELTCPDCGSIYCISPKGVSNGWKCPKCSRKQTIRERFVNLVSITGNDEYEVTETFISLDKNVKIRHLKCGKISKMKSRSFLFEGVRCRCESILSFEDAKQQIVKLGNYELVKFDSIDTQCAIHSNDCGHTFHVLYRKFIKSPRCSICFPKKMTTKCLKERIHKTTNGEYELVGEFIDQDTKIKILHTACGKITEYGPRYYHMGAVCPICNNSFDDRWEKMYNLLIEYKAEIGSTYIPKRETYKGHNLGSWCQEQRIYKKSGKLNQKRINKLNAIGFIWCPLEIKWFSKYEQYKHYIKTTGQTYISRRTNFENEHLGAWVES